MQGGDFCNQAVFSPEKKTAFVMLTNSDNGGAVLYLPDGVGVYFFWCGI